MVGCLGAAALRVGAVGARTGGPVLVRSSWQTVNIGDIAHTPGLLALLERHRPDLPVVLWPNDIGDGVEPMLRRRFPRLAIAEGRLIGRDELTTPALRAAWDEARFFLHGSGPSVVAQAQLAAWRDSGRPYGVYGVSIGEVDDELRDLLSSAAFTFCRDTDSLQALRDAGVRCPLEFAPDAAFGIDLRDEARAEEFLAQHGLEPGGFLCVVPRLRYTPYHRFRKVTGDPAEWARRDEVNAQTMEADHAKLRTVIVAWVRRTGLRVLCCPEMTYQVELLRPLLYDPLPDDVKAAVICRDRFWLPDEAGSVYARARALVSFEMHSPIIAAAHGTPAVHVRQPTDTRKGQMWADIGLGEWLFQVEQASGEAIAETVVQIHEERERAEQKLQGAMAMVRERQRETIAAVGRAIDQCS